MRNTDPRSTRHAVCWRCWRRNDGRITPTAVRLDVPVPCCWCGRRTDDGLYLTRDPKEVPCSGVAAPVHGDVW